MGKKKQVTVGQSAETSTTKSETSQPGKVNKQAVKAKRHQKTHGKAYLNAKAKVLPDKAYSLIDAVKLLKKISFEKFDASIEVHINTTEKGLKGEAILPHGTGQTLKIVLFDEEIESQIKENKINFDILLALPKDMIKLVKYAKILGPKGLMPSPKKGTLTEDPKAAIKKLSSGTINYKTEPKFPIIHQLVGKKAFSEKQLIENVQALVSGINKKYLKAFYIKSSMSPSIRVDLNTL